MKKLFLTLIMIGAVLGGQAQSLSTVRGKTRDGKTVEVKYYHGTISDQIESVKYQLVDELQTRINTLQSEAKSLQQRFDAVNAELRQLRNQVNAGNADTEGLYQEIAEKTAIIESLNEQKANLNGEMLQLEAQRLELQARYDSLLVIQQSLQDEKQLLQAEKQTLLNEKQSLEDEKQSLLSKPKPEPKVVVVQSGEKPEKTSVLGVEFGVAPICVGNNIDYSWVKGTNLGGHAAIYYGTPCLTESFPLSLEVGVDIHKFVMATCQDTTFDKMGHTDINNDGYQAYLSTADLKERLVQTCLGIPIRLCFGQPAKDRVTACFKIGVTPTINLLSIYDISGGFMYHGYYPQYGSLMPYNPVFGYGSGNCDEEAIIDIRRFNLWGNVAFGVYMPLKGTRFLLNAGVRADYSLLSLGAVSINRNGGVSLRKSGILSKGVRVLIPSIEVGLVYTIK